MPIYSKDMATVATEVARSLGILRAEGTAANPTTTTIDSAALVHQRTDQLRGMWFYINGGAQAQVARAVNAFTPYTSPGSLGRLAFLQPFSTVPSTNSTFEVYEHIHPTLLRDAVKRAVRRVGTTQLTQKVDHSIVLGTRLKNAKFELWTAGASSAPDDWTLTGTGATVAREAGEKYPGTLYSAAVTNGASQEAYLQQLLTPFALHAGESVNVKAIVHTATASRVRVRLTDGVTTWNSDYHDGEGDNELEIKDKTIADNPTSLTLQLRTETGTAIAAYWKKVSLSVGDKVYEYELTTDLIWLKEVWVEGVVDGEFSHLIPDRWYYIDRSATTPRLCFVPDTLDVGILGGRVLRVIGQKHPAEPSAETDTLEVDPQYIFYRAMEELSAHLPWGEQDRKSWQAKYAAEARMADQMERRMETRPYVSSKRVREL